MAKVRNHLTAVASAHTTSFAPKLELAGDFGQLCAGQRARDRLSLR
jgi:hypothetical protein